MSRSENQKPKVRLLGGVAVVAAAVAGLTAPAHAQAPPATGTSASGQSDEIVVTAERRSEALSRTPIAATVLNADALAQRGVNSSLDLQNVAPATVINVYNRSTFVNIRGVGLAVSAPNVVQGVPFYINGSYIAYDLTIRGTFFDLASVEILRGPQGTLTGLNSTGGAVYMRSHAPDLGVLSGYIDQGFSEYSGRRTVAAVNIPIGAQAALRVAGMDEKQDSFTTNLGSIAHPGDTNNYALRADFQVEPTDRFRVNLRAEYYRADTDYNAVKRRDDANPDPFTIAEDAISRSSINNFHADLEVNWDATSAFRARFQSAYGDAYQFDLGDRNRAVGGASNNLSLTRIDPHSISNELDLISSGTGPFQWVVGAFDLKEATPTLLYRFANCCSPIAGGGDVTTAILGIDNHSQALFGQASYQFNPLLRLVVGARYSQDQQTFRRKGGVVGVSTDIFRSDEPTGRVVLNFTPDTNTLFYGSLSRGYKQGGVNLTAGTPPFRTETNLVGELGVKTHFFDQHLSVNADVFSSQYENAQFAALVGGLPRTANAPSVASHGVELEVLGNFGELNLNLGAAYLNAEFDKATNLQDPGTGLATAVPKGRRMTFSPEWTLNAGVQYDLHFGNALVTPRVQYSYVDDQFATPFPNGATAATHNSLVPAHGEWDARLTYQATDELQFEAFVNNLTDKTYIASQMQNASSQVGGYLYGAPRVAGIRLAYKLNE